MSIHPDVPSYGSAARAHDLASDDDKFLETKCPEGCEDGIVYINNKDCWFDDCVYKELQKRQHISEWWHYHWCRRCDGKGTVHPSTVEKD